MKKLAFTLAEVLLVIAIIGTVSVLTVNNAVKSSNTAEKITSLKKTYDILQTAFMAGMDKGGAIDKWGYALDNNTNGNSNLVTKFLTPNLKLQKDCGTSTGCWKTGAKSTAYQGGQSVTFDTDTNWYKFILANGASVAIRFDFINTRTSGSSIGGDYHIEPVDQGAHNDPNGAIFVDVDGPNKSASKAGDDLYLFYITSDGIVPAGVEYGIRINTEDACPEYGEACTAWAFYKGNQDYFRCPKNLSWTDPNKTHCEE